MPTNYRALAAKLMRALGAQGRRFSMSQYTTYSQRAGRTVTKYIITEAVTDGTGHITHRKLIESWSLPDVVKALAAQLQGGETH